MSILSREAIIKRILEGERQINGDNIKIIEEIEGLLEIVCKDPNNASKAFESVTDEIESKFKKLYECTEGEDCKKKRKEKIQEHAKSLSELPYKDKEEKQPIFIDDFNFKNLQAANYDLRLGRDIYTTSDVHPKKLAHGNVGDTLKIEPGEFGVFLTHEYVYVPDDLFGLISLKFKYKAKGLVNVSGFHIDPGYHGKILFSVYNAGPSDIFLRYKEPVFMIMFNNLSGPTAKGYSNPGFENIPVDIISSLGGAPVSLKGLDKRVSTLEYQRNIYGGILISLIILFIGYLISKVIG